MKYIISFIGAGIGSHWLRPLPQTVGPDRIIVTNRSLKKAKSLADRLGCHLPQTIGRGQDANFVMLGVKPQDIHQVTKELTPSSPAIRFWSPWRRGWL